MNQNTFSPELKKNLKKLGVFKMTQENANSLNRKQPIVRFVTLPWCFAYNETPQGYDFWVKIEEQIEALK